MAEKRKGVLYNAYGKWFSSANDARAYVQSRNPVQSPNKWAGIVRLHKGEYDAVPSSPNLPQSFSLKEKMPPVYNQASRGTCAANATIALFEYYTDCKWRFSVQYLYERMKRVEQQLRKDAAKELLAGRGYSDPELKRYVDQTIANIRWCKNRAPESKEEIANILYNMPVEMDSGSTFRMAEIVLKEYGVCSYDKWPYAREQLEELSRVTDYNNRYMPPGADEEAKRHRLLDEFYNLQSPNNVEEIKRLLTGAGGNRPMPVLIGVLCDEGNTFELPGCEEVPLSSFNCTYSIVLRPVKHENGTVENLYVIDQGSVEPDVDTEQELEPKPLVAKYGFGGGHAMLLVGYEDDASYPGGGYFTVRNSWGGNWGEDGYRRISYAYIELFCFMAATIVQKMTDYTGDGYGGTRPVGETFGDAGIPEGLKPYITTADRDMRNSRGVWTISKGTKVIVDENGIAEPDNALNRKKFADQGYSWTARPQNAQDGEGKPSVSFAGGFGDSGRFRSGIESAFKQTPLAFPQFGGVKKGFLSSPKAEDFRKVADLSDRLGDLMVIYEARGRKNAFRIATVYLSSPVDAGTKAERARQLLEEYAASRRYDTCDCTISVVGASGEIASAVQPYTSNSDVGIVLDEYSAESGWKAHVASLSGGRQDDAWVEWLKRLIPNTPEQWRSRLGTAWEYVAASGGNVTLDKMSARTGLASAELKALAAEFMIGFSVKGDRIVKA